MRLNKHIAESGICSRREADQWIANGRVTINGVPATLGSQVADGDEVCVDGAPLGSKKNPVYLLLNKPPGITSTTDPNDPDNIVRFIGYKERIFPIGRLDKDSEGLILLTNNGDIVNAILREENNHEKEYVVTLDRPPTDLFFSMMQGGVKIGGVMTKPCKIQRDAADRFRIVLTQGLNRQIRRMCSALGYQVRRLQRVRIMHLQLGSMAVGRWRELTPAERSGLLRALGEPHSVS
jgi:23S rRNA pseudouridine2604 synthase